MFPSFLHSPLRIIDDPGLQVMSSTAAAWMERERVKVLQYLPRNVDAFDSVGATPAFHVEPYFAIWAVSSQRDPAAVGFWAFSGDIATDVIIRDWNDPADHPRKALIRILAQWASYIPYLERGENPPGITYGGTAVELQALVDPLRTRIETLSEWAEDDGLWDDDCPLDT